MNTITFCCFCICLTVLLIAVLIFIYHVLISGCILNTRRALTRLGNVEQYVIKIYDTVRSVRRETARIGNADVVFCFDELCQRFNSVSEDSKDNG